MTKPFTSEQVSALEELIDARLTAVATRADADKLQGLLLRILDRLDRLCPEDEVPAEHIALMAAVLAAHTGRRVRVRGARLLQSGPQGGTNPWTSAGRMANFVHRAVGRPASSP